MLIFSLISGISTEVLGQTDTTKKVLNLTPKYHKGYLLFDTIQAGEIKKRLQLYKKYKSLSITLDSVVHSKALKIDLLQNQIGNLEKQKYYLNDAYQKEKSKFALKEKEVVLVERMYKKKAKRNMLIGGFGGLVLGMVFTILVR